jgi:hypothetical protein
MSHLDESEVLTIPITKDTNYSCPFLVKNPLSGKPEDLSGAKEIVFQFKDGESDDWDKDSNVVAALHTLGATAAYVDTGAENLTFNATANTIVRSAGDWTVDNFSVGDWIRVTGTPTNDGCYKVAAVVALTLTLETADPARLAFAKNVVAAAAAPAGAAAIDAPVLPAAELSAGIITITGEPTDLTDKELGSLFGAARIRRATDDVAQAPRRAARIRLES